ncbi:MAG: AAA family ATPase [Alloprevotella sp.]|nr:AAA family ATPase [Alloprevotella sp.]
MFENFKKIQIEGGYFEPSSGLDLFDSNQCLSIIYGRNGSGKTSIAKAIRQLVGKDSKPQEGEVAVPYIVTSDAINIKNAQSLLRNSTILSLSRTHTKHIYQGGG